jgi:hypothetical protein
MYVREIVFINRQGPIHGEPSVPVGFVEPDKANERVSEFSSARLFMLIQNFEVISCILPCLSHVSCFVD